MLSRFIVVSSIKSRKHECDTDQSVWLQCIPMWVRMHRPYSFMTHVGKNAPFADSTGPLWEEF